MKNDKLFCFGLFKEDRVIKKKLKKELPRIGKLTMTPRIGKLTFTPRIGKLEPLKKSGSKS